MWQPSVEALVVRLMKWPRMGSFQPLSVLPHLMSSPSSAALRLKMIRSSILAACCKGASDVVDHVSPHQVRKPLSRNANTELVVRLRLGDEPRHKRPVMYCGLECPGADPARP